MGICHVVAGTNEEENTNAKTLQNNLDALHKAIRYGKGKKARPLLMELPLNALNEQVGVHNALSLTLCAEAPLD